MKISHAASEMKYNPPHRRRAPPLQPRP